MYHDIVSLTRPDHALACLQMIRKKGTDKRLQCQCHTIVSVPANAMGQCHCLLLNEPKVHKVWIHICIGLILSTILNLLFIFQQDGRAWDEDHNRIVLSDQCIMICTAWYDSWAVDAVFCRWLALQGHFNVCNSPNFYLNGHYRIPF